MPPLSRRQAKVVSGLLAVTWPLLFPCVAAHQGGLQPVVGADLDCEDWVSWMLDDWECARRSGRRQSSFLLEDLPSPEESLWGKSFHVRGNFQWMCACFSFFSSAATSRRASATKRAPGSGEPSVMIDSMADGGEGSKDRAVTSPSILGGSPNILGGSTGDLPEVGGSPKTAPAANTRSAAASIPSCPSP